MNYDDFPILNSLEYNKLNEHYSNSALNRNEVIDKVFKLINICVNSCFLITKQVNAQIKNKLYTCKTIMEQILENIHANFETPSKKTTEYYELSLFGLLNNLFDCIEILNSWFLKEEKIYYKNFINNTIKSLIFCIKNILKAISESKIILFKHM